MLGAGARLFQGLRSSRVTTTLTLNSESVLLTSLRRSLLCLWARPTGMHRAGAPMGGPSSARSLALRPQPPNDPRQEAMRTPRSLSARMILTLISPRSRRASARAEKQAGKENRRAAAIQLQRHFRGWRARSHANAVHSQLRLSASPDDHGHQKQREASWSYRDDSGQLRGPFTATELDHWFDAGYLPDTLELHSSLDADGRFTTLAELCTKGGGKPNFHAT